MSFIWASEKVGGLHDDYRHDGRVILETIDHSALPTSISDHSQTLLQLGQLYKQIEAPFGRLAHETLTVSTFALESNSTNDATYKQLDGYIKSWNNQRDLLGGQIKAVLEGAEFEGKTIDELQAQKLISQAEALLANAENVVNEL